jgi:hypothetical protein
MPRPEPRWIRAALAGLVLAGASACGHPLQNGTYAFTRDGAPLRDTCNLAPADGSLWTGVLTTTGEEVFINLSVPVQGQAPEVVRLNGFFKAPQYSKSDGFLVDATQLEVPAPLPGVGGGCLADQVVVHMDATVPDGDRFSGTLQVSYDLTPPPPPGACAGISRCDLQVNFLAALVNTHH